MMKLNKILSFSLAAITMFALTACQKDPEIISLVGNTMGTTYHIKYIDDGLSLDKNKIHGDIENILKDVNAKMSTYDPNSELSRFNQSREVNQPKEISADLAYVINKSNEINQLTQGAFDVTVGPLVNLWGFGPEERHNKEPSAQLIADRKAITGSDKLKLTEANNSYYLEKSIPELYVDLSAIAKGFGVDQVANYLEKNKVTNYLVEIGGELRAKGKNLKGEYWQVAIEKPEFNGNRTVQQIVPLNGLAMATSGDYRNYFVDNGKRFSHEIDPETGYPVQHDLVSVTILAKNTTIADGLSTAFFVLGEEKALAIANQQGIRAYFITKKESGFVETLSDSFKTLLTEQK